MTKTALNQLGGFKPWLDAGDIFYSKQDKLEFLSAANMAPPGNQLVFPHLFIKQEEPRLSSQ